MNYVTDTATVMKYSKANRAETIPFLSNKNEDRIQKFQISLFYSLSGISFADTDHSLDSSGKEKTIFVLLYAFPPAHEHSHICTQLCIWDDCLLFFYRATHLITTLLLGYIIPPAKSRIWMKVNFIFSVDSM